MCIRDSNNSMEANTDAILTYNNTFGKMNLSVSGGGNYRFTNASTLEITGGDLSSPNLFTLANIKAGTLTVLSLIHI